MKFRIFTNENRSMSQNVMFYAFMGLNLYVSALNETKNMRIDDCQMESTHLKKIASFVMKKVKVSILFCQDCNNI
jgi:hypothetical protein